MGNKNRHGFPVVRDESFSHYTDEGEPIEKFEGNFDPSRLELKPFKQRSAAQAQAMEVIRKHPFVFLTGPAGTGKTAVAIYLALQALKDRHIDSIVLTRPNIEAGESLGYLPGDVLQKMGPYIKPMTEMIKDTPGGRNQLNMLIKSEIIEICPLQWTRGRTFNRTWVIADEMQNASPHQGKTLLTRIGRGSKIICTMDPRQSDLFEDEPSFSDDLKRFEGNDLVGFYQFRRGDVVRSEECKAILRSYGE